MTIIKIIDAFTFYGVDVLLLAALTAAVTQVLKISVLKKLKKKILTFLPFVLGTLFYAIYECVCNLNIRLLLTDYVTIIEHGISVGAVATLLYVLHEQFIREKKRLHADRTGRRYSVGRLCADGQRRKSRKRGCRRDRTRRYGQRSGARGRNHRNVLRRRDYRTRYKTAFETDNRNACAYNCGLAFAVK